MQLDWDIIAKIGSSVIMGGTILAVMYKHIIKPLYHYIKNEQERNDKMDNLLKYILPNGGSSIMDKLDRIEAMVLTGEQASKAIISSMNIGYWKSDRKGKCIEVGPGTCRIFQRSESELLGNNWYQWLHPADKDNVIKTWNDCVRNSEDYHMDCTIVRADGTKAYVTATAYTVFDVNKTHMIGYYGILNEKQQ